MSLWDSIKSGAQNIYSDVKTAFTNVGQDITSVLSKAGSGSQYLGDVGGAVGAAYIREKAKENQNVSNTITNTPANYSPIDWTQGRTSTPPQPFGLTPAVPNYNYSDPNTPATFSIPGGSSSLVRPSSGGVNIPSNAVNQNGNYVIQQAGTGGYQIDAGSGQLTALPGLAGNSASTPSYSSNPQSSTGAQGAQGSASSRQGTLTGAGTQQGGGVPEQQRKDQNKSQNAGTPGTQTPGVSFTQQQLQDLQQQLGLTSSQLGSIQTAFGPQAQFNPSTATAGVNGLASLTDILANSAQDFSAFPELQKSITELAGNLDSYVTEKKAQIAQANPLPDNFVPNETMFADNQAELNQLLSLPSQTYESLVNSSGLNADISQLHDINAEIEALVSGKDSMVSDIASLEVDPDFPKKLADRRIAEIEKAVNIRLSALQLRSQNIKDSISYKQSEVRYQVGLVQDQVTERSRILEQRRQNAMDTINFLVSSGAITSTPDSQLASLASTAGLDFSSIKGAQSAVATKNQQAIEDRLRAINQQAFENNLAAQRVAISQQQENRLGSGSLNNKPASMSGIANAQVEQDIRDTIGAIINANPNVTESDIFNYVRGAFNMNEADDTAIKIIMAQYGRLTVTTPPSVNPAASGQISTQSQPSNTIYLSGGVPTSGPNEASGGLFNSGASLGDTFLGRLFKL